ncbi:MAG TPA: galactokinase [Clostridiales bacterium]|nr:galactokinase [Clostridiales bacterium]
MQKEQLIAKFQELYGEGGEIRTYFAPGRVNLIGEHTDYNGGHVFPCALTIGTYGVARVRKDNMLQFYSMNFEQLGVIGSRLEDLKPEKEADWTNYPKGVIWAFDKKGYPVTSGMDLLLYGNIPNGSGLSSSASVEVLTGFILRDFFGFDVTNQDLALIGQYSENNFNGVNCGIMDQFAIAMGKKDHAILLDCSTLAYEYVPLKLGDYCIVVANCNKPHNLVESKYNVRRHEVEVALKKIQEVKPIKALAELSVEEFNEVKYLLSGVVEKRAEHVVTECARVTEAVAALKRGDLAELGRLLNESHYSLRDLYEVTGKELDMLSSLARKEAGCLGSRMIGAGFGGCTISIVKKSAVEGFIRRVDRAYFDAIGYRASFYETSIEDGVTVSKL